MSFFCASIVNYWPYRYGIGPEFHNQNPVFSYFPQSR